jgi:hypothetical protein
MEAARVLRPRICAGALGELCEEELPPGTEGVLCELCQAAEDADLEPEPPEAPMAKRTISEKLAAKLGASRIAPPTAPSVPTQAQEMSVSETCTAPVKPGCTRDVRTKELCSAHYQQKLKDERGSGRWKPRALLGKDWKSAAAAEAPKPVRQFRSAATRSSPAELTFDVTAMSVAELVEAASSVTKTLAAIKLELQARQTQVSEALATHFA